jgi:excisionase family DNA binding protein
MKGYGEKSDRKLEAALDVKSMAADLQPMHKDPERLLSVDEVAEILGMSTAWVRQHSNGMRHPEIPSVKLGKCVRFRRDRVLEFIRSMERIAG